jgi:flagellin FlaB
MERNLPIKKDRGQVGIGTLIVFIAMVLVAAIAAGVLINTAGFLQSSAEESGTGASEQTTNRLEVAGSVTGVEDGSDDDIETVNINVKRESGAGNVDLEDATIQFIGPSEVSTLTQDSGGDGFTVSEVKDDDGSISGSTVLNDDTDVAQISITFNSLTNPSVSDMGPGDSATLTITTDAGGETEVRITVPDTIQSSSVTLSP